MRGIYFEGGGAGAVEAMTQRRCTAQWLWQTNARHVCVGARAAAAAATAVVDVVAVCRPERSHPMGAGSMCVRIEFVCVRACVCAQETRL